MSSFRSFIPIARKMGVISSKNSFSNEKILIGKLDLYNGIAIKSSDYKLKPQIAKKVLKNSIDKWNQDNVQAVWFEINVEVSSLNCFKLYKYLIFFRMFGGFQFYLNKDLLFIMLNHTILW